MVQLAIQDTPEFALTDLEIQPIRQILFHRHHPRAPAGIRPRHVAFFFIIGLDAFLDLPSWKEADALLNNCHFVVISRPSTTFQAMASIPLFQDVPQTRR
jgi:nicotinate-nucleotide adenylyltransferase